MDVENQPGASKNREGVVANPEEAAQDREESIEIQQRETGHRGG